MSARYGFAAAAAMLAAIDCWLAEDVTFVME
jgi:hypothetical protein